MRAPEPDSHIALMAAVIGGVSLFTEPRESTAQKWLYWAQPLRSLSYASHWSSKACLSDWGLVRPGSVARFVCSATGHLGRARVSLRLN